MCKWIVVETSSEFRHVDLVKFEELIASLRLDYEKGYWLALDKLIES